MSRLRTAELAWTDQDCASGCTIIDKALIGNNNYFVKSYYSRQFNYNPDASGYSIQAGCETNAVEQPGGSYIFDYASPFFWTNVALGSYDSIGPIIHSADNLNAYCTENLVISGGFDGTGNILITFVEESANMDTMEISNPQLNFALGLALAFVVFIFIASYFKHKS